MPRPYNFSAGPAAIADEVLVNDGTLAELHAAEGVERQRLADTVSRLFLRQSTRQPGGPSDPDR